MHIFTVIKIAGYMSRKLSSINLWNVASFSTIKTNIAVDLAFFIESTSEGIKMPFTHINKKYYYINF